MEVYDGNRQLYGRPRIFADLTEAGEKVGEKRVGRLMKQAGIQGASRRKRGPRTTQRNKDAWSRRIVGWSMATHLRTELVLEALNMATWQRRPKAVIHSRP